MCMLFQYAVMVHCKERGDEMIVGDLSHLHIYEQGGSAQVSVARPPVVGPSSIGQFLFEGALCEFVC